MGAWTTRVGDIVSLRLMPESALKVASLRSIPEFALKGSKLTVREAIWSFPRRPVLRRARSEVFSIRLFVLETLRFFICAQHRCSPIFATRVGFVPPPWVSLWFAAFSAGVVILEVGRPFGRYVT